MTGTSKVKLISCHLYIYTDCFANYTIETHALFGWRLENLIIANKVIKVKCKKSENAHGNVLPHVEAIDKWCNSMMMYGDLNAVYQRSPDRVYLFSALCGEHKCLLE